MKNAKFWIVMVVAALVITAIVEWFNRPVEDSKFIPITEHSEIPER